MLILDRSCLLVTLLCLLLWFPPCFSVDESDAGDIKAINEIMDWVRSNGGWISDKLEVRQIFGSLSGIFTNEALKEGEVVAEIPWHLIIKPSHHEAHWCEAGWKVRSVITKDSSQQNPYERYLASRSVSYAPLMWSAKSKRLLAQLFSGIPNNGFFDHDFDNECEGAGEDFDYAKALVLLKTRGEGESVDFLVPFEELLNHRNGNFTNVDPEIKSGESVRIVTTRMVQQGEQLQSSYNQCPWCDGQYSNPANPRIYQVTAQLFEVYGFVESIPQRWVIPQFRILFDIVHSKREGAEEDEVDVDFIVPPSEAGLSFLKHRLNFLESFEKENKDRGDIPGDEYAGLFAFHEAIVKAFSLALEHGKEVVSDQVWSLDEDSWYTEYDSYNDNEVDHDEF